MTGEKESNFNEDPNPNKEGEDKPEEMPPLRIDDVAKYARRVPNILFTGDSGEGKNYEQELGEKNESTLTFFDKDMEVSWVKDRSGVYRVIDTVDVPKSEWGSNLHAQKVTIKNETTGDSHTVSGFELRIKKDHV